MQRSGGSKKMQGKQDGVSRSRSRLLLELFVIININMMMINISTATSPFFQLHDPHTLTRRTKFFITTSTNDAAAVAVEEETLVFTPTTTSTTHHDDNDDDDDDDDDDDSSSAGNNKYALIFDAGSTGSRVHVFKFDSHLNLLPIINHDFEFVNRTVPGLSAYADNPKAAADSLKLLLNQAQDLVPTHLHPQTPLRLGATAGLRLLSGDTAERILEAVRELFKSESSLNYKAEWVSVIEGFEEGSYMWVSINYLLGNLGKPYSETAGVVDLGGGSVQMNYAISEETAANAPTPTPNPSGGSGGGGGDQDSYLAQWNLNGTTYYLYAHSYLRYGLEASRAEILKLSGDAGNPCVINGYQGTYNYSGEVYKVSVPPSGTDKHRCRALIKKALNLCPQKNCTFNGDVWNGGGGDGQNILYLATSFYYTAAAANIVDQSMRTWTEIYPWEYLKAANVACKTDMENVKSIYPYARDGNLPYICMDLVYIYTLLVDGFGLDPKKEMRVVQNMEYKGSEFEAAWPLGCAIDSLSPLTSRLHALVYV